MAQQCLETSDNVLLKMNLGELNQSVAELFIVCAEEITKHQQPPQQDDPNEETSPQEEINNEESAPDNTKDICDKISSEAVDKNPEIVSEEILGNIEVEEGNKGDDGPGEPVI